MHLQHGPHIHNETWLSYVLPEEKSSSNYLADFKDYDGCKMFQKVDKVNPNLASQDVKSLNSSGIPDYNAPPPNSAITPLSAAKTQVRVIFE